jgi:hypothetical protein
VLVIFIQIQDFVKILQVRPFGVVLAIRCSVVTNAAAIASWHTKDTLARGYLISTIESQQQRSLINCNTAHEMWIRLSAQYLRNAVENRYFFLLQKGSRSQKPSEVLCINASIRFANESLSLV